MMSHQLAFITFFIAEPFMAQARTFQAQLVLQPLPLAPFAGMVLPMKAAMKKVAMKGSAMKKVMKAKRAMKKVMKAKRVSVIAKGKMARSAVFSGRKQKTQSGLTKDKLIKNKFGRVVSKARSANAKRAYKNTLKVWADAVKSARKELGLSGFVAIGGKSATGKALYAKAKSIMAR